MAFWIEDIQKQMGIFVMMVEHDMGLVSAVSGRVMALSDGKELATGTAAEIQSHPAVIEAYLGTGTISKTELPRQKIHTPWSFCKSTILRVITAP